MTETPTGPNREWQVLYNRPDRIGTYDQRTGEIMLWDLPSDWLARRASIFRELEAINQDIVDHLESTGQISHGEVGPWGLRTLHPG